MRWISQCLSSATVSVLVNGSPTDEFKVSRGLRQGDPLSPLLFLVAAEGFNRLVKRAIETNLLRGIEIGNDRVIISHVQFADDTILCCKSDFENIWAIKCLLRIFELASGLKVNFLKSNLFGFNTDRQQLLAFADMLNCNLGELPFKYLGVSIGLNPKAWIFGNQH